MTGNYMLPGGHTRHLHPPHHPSAYSQSSATTRLPSNHSTSPHDQAKLDKKRERNRIAASKCRQRKLEKIQTLGETLQNPSRTFLKTFKFSALQKSNFIDPKRNMKRKIALSKGFKKLSTFTYKMDAQLNHPQI